MIETLPGLIAALSPAPLANSVGSGAPSPLTAIGTDFAGALTDLINGPGVLKSPQPARQAIAATGKIAPPAVALLQTETASVVGPTDDRDDSASTAPAPIVNQEEPQADPALAWLIAPLPVAPPIPPSLPTLVAPSPAWQPPESSTSATSIDALIVPPSSLRAGAAGAPIPGPARAAVTPIQMALPSPDPDQATVTQRRMLDTRFTSAVADRPNIEFGADTSVMPPLAKSGGDNRKRDSREKSVDGPIPPAMTALPIVVPTLVARSADDAAHAAITARRTVSSTVSPQPDAGSVIQSPGALDQPNLATPALRVVPIPQGDTCAPKPSADAAVLTQLPVVQSDPAIRDITASTSAPVGDDALVVVPFERERSPLKPRPIAASISQPVIEVVQRTASLKLNAAARQAGLSPAVEIVRPDRRPRDASSADPVANVAVSITPIAPVPVDASGQAGIDLTRDPGLHRMIDRIETLRDAAAASDPWARDTRIRLIPDALGPVDVAVRREGDAVQVHFTAADPATRQLIADAQPRLTELAESRGVRIERTTVDGGATGNGGMGQPRPQPQSAALNSTPLSARNADEPETTDDRIA